MGANLLFLKGDNLFDMNVDKIGQPGIGGASRAMNMDPSESRVWWYDEYSKGKLRYPLFLLTFLAFFGAAYFFFYEEWTLGAGLIVFFFIFTSLLRGISKADPRKVYAYKSGLLIPGLIINTSPIEIIALAEITKEDGVPVQYGCIKIRVNHLPHHSITLYEKVPCAALFFGFVDESYWHHFSPRPISWGFKESALIDRAIHVIDEDLENGQSEWMGLHSLASRMASVPAQEMVIFDDQLKKIESHLTSNCDTH